MAMQNYQLHIYSTTKDLKLLNNLEMIYNIVNLNVRNVLHILKFASCLAEALVSCGACEKRIQANSVRVHMDKRLCNLQRWHA